MKYPSGESFDQAAHESCISNHLVYRRLAIDMLRIMVTAPCITGSQGVRSSGERWRLVAKKGIRASFRLVSSRLVSSRLGLGYLCCVSRCSILAPPVLPWGYCPELPCPVCGNVLTGTCRGSKTKWDCAIRGGCEIGRAQAAAVLSPDGPNMDRSRVFNEAQETEGANRPPRAKLCGSTMTALRSDQGMLLNFAEQITATVFGHDKAKEARDSACNTYVRRWLNRPPTPKETAQRGACGDRHT
jgi:hypothetical protein